MTMAWLTHPKKWIDTSFQKVAVDCMLSRKALILSRSRARSRLTFTSVSGAPKALAPMSEGWFLKKAMSSNMVAPPIRPIPQNAVFQDAPAIKALTRMAITAGPRPWEAWRNPTPHPRWVRNQ